MSKRVRVGICALRHRGWMGGKIYLQNILTAARGLEGRQIETVLVSGEGDDNNDLRALADDVVVLEELKMRGLGPWRHKVQSWLRSKTLERAGVQVLFPFEHAAAHRGIRKIAWIPDFQHKYLREFFTTEEYEGREHQFAAIADTAHTVVVSSENAAADFRQFYPDSKTKVEVLSFSTVPATAWFEDRSVEVRKKYGVPEKYFIVCNQFWKHKNHRTVFEAVALLTRKGMPVHIVCTGATEDFRDPEGACYKTLRAFLEEAGIASHVQILGLIPREDQLQLLKGATAVIQPSLFEGWSTVLEDARVFGQRVLASNLTVHLEQNLDGAVYFDPLDAEMLAGKMDEAWAIAPVLRDTDFLKSQCAERSRKFGQRFSEIVINRWNASL